MLVLSRKPDETIIIADDIRITLLSIQGKQVRLGIDAPNDVTVHREEVHKRIKEEKKSEAASEE